MAAGLPTSCSTQPVPVLKNHSAPWKSAPSEGNLAASQIVACLPTSAVTGRKVISSFNPLLVTVSLTEVPAGLSVNDALLPVQVTLTVVSEVGPVAVLTSDTVEPET